MFTKKHFKRPSLHETIFHGTSVSRRPDTVLTLRLCLYNQLKCQFLVKTSTFFWYWYISESQNIYACADGIFEQERKTQYLWTSRQSVVPEDTGISTRASLSDMVGPSLISVTDLHPDTAVRERNVDPHSV